MLSLSRIAAKAKEGFWPRSADVLLKGSLFAFAIQLLGTGIKYAQQVLLARWMGASEYGVFVYAYNWTTLLMVVSGFGLTSAAVRFVPEYIAQAEWGLLRGFVARSSQIVFVGGVGVALVGACIVHGGSAPQSQLPLWLGLAAVPLYALALHVGQLARGMKDMLLAFIPVRIVQPLLSILLVLIAVKVMGSASGVVALLALIASVAGVILIEVIGIGRVIPKEATCIRPVMAARQWVRVAFPMMVGGVAYATITQVAVSVLGIMSPPRDVGIYSAATAISNLVAFILVAVNAIVAPMISELFTLKEHGRLGELVRAAILWMLVPASLTTCGIIVFGHTALRLFGPEFVTGYAPLLVLTFGQLINAITGPVGYVTELTGHQGYSAMVYLICALISAGLNIMFIRTWGILGAAFATSLAVALSNIWLYVYVSANILGRNAPIPFPQKH